MDNNYHNTFYHTQEDAEKYPAGDSFSDKYQAEYDYNGALPDDYDLADCRRTVRGTVSFA